ncbi:MAG: M48 family metalloprotease [bacterium]|nr:M48 family metalloprotease [bacterium]
MGGTETTVEPVPAESAIAAATACPRCSEPCGDLPAVSTTRFGELGLRRCQRCGSRYTAGDPPARVVACENCGIASIEQGKSGTTTCEVCSAAAESTYSDDGVALATETEVLSALDREVETVTSETLAAYLDRVARLVADQMQDAPQSPRVVIVDNGSFETLALPSGTLLISRGMLATLQDEAELVFMLAHELAHVATGAAAGSLVRLSLGQVTRRAESDDDGWILAAMDLIRLGHGTPAEHEADTLALDTLLALEYDPQSALRFLRRIERRIDDGGSEAQEYALAHPPPRDRARRLERALARAAESDSPPRVNRDVFRRAAGTQALESSLTRVRGLGDAFSPPEAADTSGPDMRRLVWSAVGIFVLTGLILAAGWILAR